MRGIRILAQTAKNLSDTLLLGQVTKVNGNLRTVTVTKMDLDTKLRMYFNKKEEFKCLDDKNQSKQGDIILMQSGDDPKDPFKLVEVTFKIGTYTNPKECEQIPIRQ